MAQVTFRHGEPRMIDHTATADRENGDVVLLGNTTSPTCGVMHTELANGAKGAIAVQGGVYEGVNLNNAANYALVYWDFAGGTEKFTTTSTNNAKFGYVVRDGGGGANSNCFVIHDPMV